MIKYSGFRAGVCHVVGRPRVWREIVCSHSPKVLGGVAALLFLGTVFTGCAFFAPEYYGEEYVTLNNPPGIWEQYEVDEVRYGNAVVGDVRGSLIVLPQARTAGGKFVGPYRIGVELSAPTDDWSDCRVTSAEIRAEDGGDYSQYFRADDATREFEEDSVNGVDHVTCFLWFARDVPFRFREGSAISVSIDLQVRSASGVTASRMAWAAEASIDRHKTSFWMQ